MKPIIYIRETLAEKEEIQAANKYFHVLTQRTHIKANELVIMRYTSLPFNQELCSDIKELNSKPVNSYQQHLYVADLKNWYEDLKEFTPKTWFSLENLPDNTSFILKGQTNSKKLLWNTHCFAQDKRAALNVYDRLSQDGVISYQDIYVREYVPLKQLAIGLNGLPISEEYRFFVLNGKIFASGFYWSSHVDELDIIPDSSIVPKKFLEQIIKCVDDKINFWCFDIARKNDGDWLLIELNDGCQSGLSEIKAEDFYRSLAQELNYDLWNE